MLIGQNVPTQEIYTIQEGSQGELDLKEYASIYGDPSGNTTIHTINDESFEPLLDFEVDIDINY